MMSSAVSPHHLVRIVPLLQTLPSIPPTAISRPQGTFVADAQLGWEAHADTPSLSYLASAVALASAWFPALRGPPAHAPGIL
jgi:hypothetical protein